MSKRLASQRNAMPGAAEYAAWLGRLKEEVHRTRLAASLSVNRELILLYWRLGRSILPQQTAAGWGTKVIDRLAGDLRQSFPEMAGFSSRNLKYMRTFAAAWPDEAIVQQVVALLPRLHCANDGNAARRFARGAANVRTAGILAGG
ncbi:DUF1016 N-terminal domain-containing protein [Cupriavidus necator]|uniref:DUF1016 N-terminal domain-containing protein n=1 Tax=Cupriavidus necator TaxID=106590 RepID=UPI0009BF7C26|nr:DUF1016 N-terminal domain-containing protein [Cupriavidus necator]